MPRKGRDIELDIKGFEELLTDEFRDVINIISPGYVYNYCTMKKNREVDVVLEINLGPHNLMIGIECRKRKHKEDVTWIEQLVTKKECCHFNRLIAVSSEDFTEPAKILANLKGIELRLFKDFHPEEIINEINKSIEFTDRRWKINNMEMKLIGKKSESKNRKKEMAGQYKIYEKCFVYKDKKFSMSEIISNIDKAENIFVNVQPNSLPLEKIFEIDFEDNEELYFIVDDKQFKINHMKIFLKLWIEKYRIPFKKAKKYSKDVEILGEHYEYEIPPKYGNGFDLAIQKSKIKPDVIRFSIKNLKKHKPET